MLADCSRESRFHGFVRLASLALFYFQKMSDSCAQQDQESIVWSRPASTQRPHVLIECAQNSACTMFALFLCNFLEDTQICLKDTSACSGDLLGESHLEQDNNRWTLYYEYVLSTAHESTVVTKGTFNSFGINDEFFSRSFFTHRILWFRDPVQNIISLSEKRWCNGCGGIAEKMITADDMYSAFYLKKLTPFFDMVIFEHDFFIPQKLQSLLTALGLLGNTTRGYALPRFSRGGNFRPPILAPVQYPKYCYAVDAAKVLTPQLYFHFFPHGLQCVDEFPANVVPYCLSNLTYKTEVLNRKRRTYYD